MARERVRIKGLREVTHDLEAMFKPRIVHAVAAKIENKNKEVIKVIIGHAKSGLGAQNKRYQKYSRAYAREKAKKGSLNGRWLRGIGRTGRSGGMLDEIRFIARMKKKRLYIVWTPADPKMGVYGHVHNAGLPIGKGGPIKQREFMTLDWQGGLVAVNRLFFAAMDQIVAAFNNNKMKALKIG